MSKDISNQEDKVHQNNKVSVIDLELKKNTEDIQFILNYNRVNGNISRLETHLFIYNGECVEVQSSNADEEEKKKCIKEDIQKACNVLVETTMDANLHLDGIIEDFKKRNPASDICDTKDIRELLSTIFINIAIEDLVFFVNKDWLNECILATFYRKADHLTFASILESFKINVDVSPLSIFKKMLSQQTEKIAFLNHQVLIKTYKEQICDMVDNEGTSLLDYFKKHHIKEKKIIDYMKKLKYKEKNDEEKNNDTLTRNNVVPDSHETKRSKQ